MNPDITNQLRAASRIVHAETPFKRHSRVVSVPRVADQPKGFAGDLFAALTTRSEVFGRYDEIAVNLKTQ